MFTRNYGRMLSHLSAISALIAGTLMHANTERQYQRYALPGGKVYASRSRYTPGGPSRNCGERGISPKKLRRA